jgi:hydroxyethylthiazole kinase
MDRAPDEVRLWAERTAACLSRLRAEAPQVHVLTSTVAQPLSANLLLAAGARPSMSAEPGEIDAFAERTQALVVNLGMLEASRREAVVRALPILERRGVAWVLDPVKVDRSPARLAFARSLLDHQPAVVRANAAEMAALAPAGAAVRATTGEIDHIAGDGRTLDLAGGHPLMAHVTAMGCAGTGLIAAFLAVEPDAFTAAACALLALAVAGEIAGEKAGGPGSFPAAFLDVLHALDGDTLARRARLG